MIYLDYSSNTPVDPDVLDTFVKIESTYIGNPNSLHTAGVAAKEKLADLTDSIASLIGVLSNEIIYTSGASEANNLAVKGIAKAQNRHGKHIISTPLEHASVSGPLTWLQDQGYEIDFLNIGENGQIDTKHLKNLIRDDTILVAVTAVDSELGTVQPIQEISKILKEYPNCKLHVDATQAIGKIPFLFDGINTVSLAAHKFYGLNGSGILFKRKGVELEPLIHGGASATVYRSGTPTLGLVAALEEALKKALNTLQDRYEYVKMLNERLRREFKKYSAVEINSPVDAVPHILNLSVSGIKGTRMQKLLSEQGVCVSVKSACSTDGTPSKAVLAVNPDRKNALSSWRISLSHLTTEDEIKDFLEIFEGIVV